jgi:hypothetical protein
MPAIPGRRTCQDCRPVLEELTQLLNLALTKTKVVMVDKVIEPGDLLE